MTNFILRYLGVLTTGFILFSILPLGKSYYILLATSTVAITVSNICYYRMGERGEFL